MSEKVCLHRNQWLFPMRQNHETPLERGFGVRFICVFPSGNSCTLKRNLWQLYSPKVAAFSQVRKAPRGFCSYIFLTLNTSSLEQTLYQTGLFWVTIFHSLSSPLVQNCPAGWKPPHSLSSSSLAFPFIDSLIPWAKTCWVLPHIGHWYEHLE